VLYNNNQCYYLCGSTNKDFNYIDRMTRQLLLRTYIMGFPYHLDGFDFLSASCTCRNTNKNFFLILHTRTFSIVACGKSKLLKVLILSYYIRTFLCCLILKVFKGIINFLGLIYILMYLNTMTKSHPHIT